MNQFFYQITRKASDLINSDDYRERNIARQTAFTRNRKLSFPCYDRFAAEFSHKNDADRA